MTCSPFTTSRGPDPNTRHGFSHVLVIAMRAGLLGIALTALAACEEPPRLPALGADISRSSVSGLSSGAYMAGQFQIANSSIIIGAGLVAGGPYGCAESVFGRMTPQWPVALAQNLNRAVNGCTGSAMASLGVPDVERLARRARDRAGSKSIDKLEFLMDDRVYLFTGKADRTMARSLVRKAGGLYEALGVAKTNIALVEDIASGHGFVTVEGGGACEASVAPFVNDCDYDQAGEILKHIYGSSNSEAVGQIKGFLKPPSSEPENAILLFGQDEFTGGSGHGLDDVGAVYIPQSCMEKKGCRVHIAFHGCAQSREAVDDAFVKGSGYNRWAATNRLIVLYPQVSKSAANSRGCWDWWGYTGPEFLTRDAAQVKAVRAMLARLAE